ncbi:MAG: hypothetical protein R2771_00475 [Saprospiraceae bacterium]
MDRLIFQCQEQPFPNGYKFEWQQNYVVVSSDTAFTNNVTNLATGTVNLRIKDKNGCLYKESFELESKYQMELLDSTVVDPVCFEDGTGTIHLVTDLNGYNGNKKL